MAKPKSGKRGLVRIGASTLTEISNWVFNRTSENPSWASSTSPGYKKRVAGVKDGSGTFDYKIDDDNPMEGTLIEGTSVTLLLDEDSTASPVRTWTVPAIVDDISMTVDMDTGEPIGGTVSWSTDGEWTEPTTP